MLFGSTTFWDKLYKQFDKNVRKNTEDNDSIKPTKRFFLFLVVVDFL